MTEAQEDILLFNELSDIEVWLYANPLKGSHAKLKENPNCIAVFKDESVGRSYEKDSKILQSMIGYYVPWNEMINIANSECNGRYIFYTESKV